jgi:hypothetical protein
MAWADLLLPYPSQSVGGVEQATKARSPEAKKYLIETILPDCIKPDKQRFRDK